MRASGVIDGPADPLYIEARRVLLDALEALEGHRDALVIVGAQAVYLRFGEDDIAVAPFTTDADLAFEPELLGTDPAIENAMAKAGFARAGGDQVGTWLAPSDGSVEVHVDLLVPASLSPGPGRRGARLKGHDGRAARRATGLEGVVVDHDEFEVASLDPRDERRRTARVAGPAAIVVAKLHKIADRAGSDRLLPKDALDIARVLRGADEGVVVTRFRGLLEDPRSADQASWAIEELRVSFARRGGVGLRLMSQALGGLPTAGEVVEAARLLAADLVDGV